MGDITDPREPDPNAQHPVVIIDKTTHEITYTGTYWYLAHFSKFVRPGAVRVETTGKTKGVRVMTFQTPESGYVAQVLNSLNENRRESGIEGENVAPDLARAVHHHGHVVNSASLVDCSSSWFRLSPLAAELRSGSACITLN